MASFFAELKRRHIYRITAAYAVVAWIMLQLVNNVAPILDLPVWVARTCLLLLALGFPVAIFFAWMREYTPSEPTSKGGTTPLDWSLMVALVVVIALVTFQELASSPNTIAPPRQAGVEAARAAAATAKGAIAIAVMPFANLSSDKDQEFFSDGITDEIGTALAKIPDLRVVARQSAYRFKGGKEDARAIGQALSATHLLEGSVRKAGNRVRISAELVKADDGLRVWGENYDRDLTDVFAIQEDIAHAIAASMRMPLGLKQGENIINARTGDPGSHEAYLRAKGLVRTRLIRSLDEAIRILEGVVSHDQNYAPAWGLLGTAHHFRLLVDPAVLLGAPEKTRPVVAEHMAKGRAAADKAIMLDPMGADGYVALAEMRDDVGDHLAGMDAVQHALALDPDHPEALQSYSVQLAHMGYVKQALMVRDHLLAVEPFVPVFQIVTARILFSDGQTDKAIAILESQQRPSPQILEMYASIGRFHEAADVMVALGKNAAQMNDPDFAAAQRTAEKLLRAAPAEPPLNERPELGAFDWIYLYVGVPDRFMGMYEKGVRNGFQAGGVNGAEWAPAYAQIRKTERFKKYIRDTGILTYWRAKAWPPQCHATAGDDFVCE